MLLFLPRKNNFFFSDLQVSATEETFQDSSDEEVLQPLNSSGNFEVFGEASALFHLRTCYRKWFRYVNNLDTEMVSISLLLITFDASFRFPLQDLGTPTTKRSPSSTSWHFLRPWRIEHLDLACTCRLWQCNSHKDFSKWAKQSRSVRPFF